MGVLRGPGDSTEEEGKIEYVLVATKDYHGELITKEAMEGRLIPTGDEKQDER